MEQVESAHLGKAEYLLAVIVLVQASENSALHSSGL